MTFHFNDDTIDVVHVPLAHTDGDTVLYFRNADVLHTGDAFISGGYPLIDVASGGSIKGQIEATQTLIDMIGNNTIVVSGHYFFVAASQVPFFRRKRSAFLQKIPSICFSVRNSAEV